MVPARRVPVRHLDYVIEIPARNRKADEAVKKVSRLLHAELKRVGCIQRAAQERRLPRQHHRLHGCPLRPTIPGGPEDRARAPTRLSRAWKARAGLRPNTRSRLRTSPTTWSSGSRSWRSPNSKTRSPGPQRARRRGQRLGVGDELGHRTRGWCSDADPRRAVLVWMCRAHSFGSSTSPTITCSRWYRAQRPPGNWASKSMAMFSIPNN